MLEFKQFSKVDSKQKNISTVISRLSIRAICKEVG